MKNNKGQIYILAAIILGFVVFILFSRSNIIRKTITEDDFEQLSKNYEIESSKFINQMLLENKDIPDSFLKFTILFTSYSKTQNPLFNLIYVYEYNDNLYIGNYLNETLVIEKSGKRYSLTGCFDKIKASLSVAGLSLQISNLDYSLIDSCTAVISAPEKDEIYPISLIINDFVYSIDVIAGNPELVIVSREEKSGNRKVFTKGKFRKGGLIESDTNE